MSQSEKSSETVNEEQAQGFVEKVKMSAEEKLNLLSAVSTDLVEEVGVEEMTKIFSEEYMKDYLTNEIDRRKRIK